MPGKKLSIGFAALLAIFAVTILMTATVAPAQTETVIYGFNHVNAAGLDPVAGLVSDADGNLYGTTFDGNGNGEKGGSVFELTKMCGSWTEKTLHRFGNGNDGYNPAASLILDRAGNLYGTTWEGGTGSCQPNNPNCGTVFELTPSTGGEWTEKILFNFTNYSEDGAYPLAGLTLDAAGNLYGTTSAGGSNGGGVVFELSPSTGGEWRAKILSNLAVLSSPEAGVIFDGSGNLYGTTSGGGAYDGGTVFELLPTSDGTWTEKVLYSFPITEGVGPTAPVVFDSAGNLYGITLSGGDADCQIEVGGCGTVFELSPAGDGEWTESTLHEFLDSPTDGAVPEAGLVLDNSGNLFGTTNRGGNGKLCPYPTFGCGTVFELKPAGDGVWNETILHVFGTKDDGLFPAAGLIFDKDRTHLYGTTTEGGPYATGPSRGGTVYEITP
jgi:uncharacterized repeat protein (TIGR03803 family)